MKTEQRALKKHLFICCNEKDSGDFCGSKKPQELINELKARLRENELWDEYKVTKSGCLGPCSEGISATLYPDNLLLTEISKDDIEELYNLLTN
jgi:predicted metal-binding protein